MSSGRDDFMDLAATRLAQLGEATVSSNCASIDGSWWPPAAVTYPWPTWTVSNSPIGVIHYFTGAPKNEAKDFPCGAPLVTRRIDGDGGFALAGAQAATDIGKVTCLGCLRALIKK